jgi:selenocysteine lyase/cysteine desulfurase
MTRIKNAAGTAFEKDGQAEGSIRISLSSLNTLEDMDRLAESLKISLRGFLD